MITLEVHHQNGQYPIYIGDSLLYGLADRIPDNLRTSRACIVSDRTVWNHFGSIVTRALDQQIPIRTPFVFAPGERSKSMRTYQRLLNHLCSIGMSRNDFIIALGGGVTGDLAGFAAATFMRGIPFIQIPTTLLAQVDSAVGGKTGVNVSMGKNMAGAFYPPRCVITDTATLSTLPVRHIRNGMAEVVKIALAADAAFFTALCSPGAMESPAANAGHLTHIIHTACRLKAHIVETDEMDHGIREWLNLGHTFGHAIETVHGFKTLLHGEAVALGILAATYYAATASICPPGLLDTVTRLFTGIGLPTALETLDCKAAVAAMSMDKKRRSGRVRLVLPVTPGSVRIVDDVEMDLVEKSFRFLVR